MIEPALVTVIAVCYNHARFVVECLDSIHRQDHPRVQLVIMDDCSADDSAHIIREWIARSAVECDFIVHSENQGLCRTLNEALTLARGKYIAIIATDDTWLPFKLSDQVIRMEALPEKVGVLYSDAYQIDEDGHRLPKMFMDSHEQRGAAPEGDIREQLISGNFIPAMSTLIRRSVYSAVGNYDERLAFEDLDFWLRTSARFGFAYSPVPSANYRILESSMTRAVLTKRSSAIYYTYFLIYQKLLAMPDLAPATKSTIIKQLALWARGLYATDHSKAASALLASFMAARDFTDFGLALLASIGISYKRYSRTVSYLRWKLRGSAGDAGEGPAS